MENRFRLKKLNKDKEAANEQATIDIDEDLVKREERLIELLKVKEANITELLIQFGERVSYVIKDETAPKYKNVTKILEPKIKSTTMYLLEYDEEMKQYDLMFDKKHTVSFKTIKENLPTIFSVFIMWIGLFMDYRINLHFDDDTPFTCKLQLLDFIDLVKANKRTLGLITNLMATIDINKSSVIFRNAKTKTFEMYLFKTQVTDVCIRKVMEEENITNCWAMNITAKYAAVIPGQTAEDKRRERKQAEEEAKKEHERKQNEKKKEEEIKKQWLQVNNPHSTPGKKLKPSTPSTGGKSKTATPTTGGSSTKKRPIDEVEDTKSSDDDDVSIKQLAKFARKK